MLVFWQAAFGVAHAAERSRWTRRTGLAWCLKLPNAAVAGIIGIRTHDRRQE